MTVGVTDTFMEAVTNTVAVKVIVVVIVTVTITVTIITDAVTETAAMITGIVRARGSKTAFGFR